MDYNTILLIIVIIEGFIIMRGLLELSKQIDAGLEDLDSSLAEAIQTVVKNLVENMGIGSNFEPPNPIQQAIAGFIQNKMNESEAIPLGRAVDGKFSKQD